MTDGKLSDLQQALEKQDEELRQFEEQRAELVKRREEAKKLRDDELVSHIFRQMDKLFKTIETKILPDFKTLIEMAEEVGKGRSDWWKAAQELGKSGIYTELSDLLSPTKIKSVGWLEFISSAVKFNEQILKAGKETPYEKLRQNINKVEKPKPKQKA